MYIYFAKYIIVNCLFSTFQETYPSFHYTSLLYLNNFDKDFKGGRFIFVDGKAENTTTSVIEPKKARISAFTSGEENRHHVEKVIQGER